MTISVELRHCAAAAFALCAALMAAAPAVRAGDAEPVTVREPAFGLPHFYAATDVALARENGREIAKDRLGQLILLARVGRGTLSEVFAALDPSTLDDDIFARQTQYTSRELNDMFAKLPERDRNILLAYCAGVNDTIERVYTGELPEPVEVNILRTLGFAVLEVPPDHNGLCPEDLATGDGRLVTREGRTAAVYRDEQGACYALSPTCTHLGCTVAWNRHDKTWDCPCHGGRFSMTGEVMSGPPTEPLAMYERSACGTGRKRQD